MTIVSPNQQSLNQSLYYTNKYAPNSVKNFTTTEMPWQGNVKLRREIQSFFRADKNDLSTPKIRKQHHLISKKSVKAEIKSIQDQKREMLHRSLKQFKKIQTYGNKQRIQKEYWKQLEEQMMLETDENDLSKT